MATRVLKQIPRAATPTPTERLLVNLSPEPAVAKVVREGYQVPPVAFDTAKTNFFIDNLRQIDVRAEPRVVSQSVPAGTKVLPGTTIDLVLALTSDIPINILDKPHRDLINKSIADVTNGLLADNTVRQTLLKYDTPDQVPAADKQALTAQFAQNGITVNEANADTGFAAAFNTARGALAFR